MLRRAFLSCVLAAVASPLLGQQKPKPIVLPKSATAPVLSAAIHPPKKERSLWGWLVCNGAEVERAAYPELFTVIGERFGSGDGQQTFNLPADRIEMKNEEAVRGIAICPFSALGLVGELSAFDLDSNL